MQTCARAICTFCLQWIGVWFWVIIKHRFQAFGPPQPPWQSPPSLPPSHAHPPPTRGTNSLWSFGLHYHNIDIHSRDVGIIAATCFCQCLPYNYHRLCTTRAYHYMRAERQEFSSILNNRTNYSSTQLAFEWDARQAKLKELTQVQHLASQRLISRPKQTGAKQRTVSMCRKIEGTLKGTYMTLLKYMFVVVLAWDAQRCNEKTNQLAHSCSGW